MKTTQRPYSLRERFLTGLFTQLSRLLHRWQQLPKMPAGPYRILILKPCCLGDVLLTTPVLSALRAHFPDCVIDYAVGHYSAPAIQNHLEIRHILDMGPGAGRNVRSVLRLLRQVHARRYDICLVLDRSPLFTLMPLLAGIAVRAGIDSSGRGFALNVRVPWDESLHEADLYLSVAAALGCAVENHHLRFEPGGEAIQHFDHVWQEHRFTGPVIILAPGGGTNPGMDLPEKRWLPERFAELGDRLQQHFNAHIVLLGGPSDKDRCAQVAATMKTPSIDLSGAAPFGERGALLKKAALYIGNDSGPTHLAVAVNCPVVAIFGPTSQDLYGPYNALHSRTIFAEVPCRPCFIHGHFPPCPNQHVCMRTITVETVYQACISLLQIPVSHEA